MKHNMAWKYLYIVCIFTYQISETIIAVRPVAGFIEGGSRHKMF